MILVDTSVWVDHLRAGDSALADLLLRGGVFIHPFVVGELACGSLARRQATLDLLQDLPMAPLAEADEVLKFIERHALHGQGAGLVDMHLLAATALADGARLWTRDKRLHALATTLGLQHASAH